MTDEELLIYNTLKDNWNISYAPDFYYTDAIQIHDYHKKDAIKIYLLNVNEEPRGLGYVSYKNEIILAIDIRSSNRDRMMQDRDEVKRIIRANRKTLQQNFDIFKKSNERKVNSFLNYYQYVIEVRAVKYQNII